MLSPWRSPLPLEEYTMSQVIVYFYSGRWIPIMFHSLVDAIALYRRANLEGREIFIFPPDSNPYELQEYLKSTVLPQKSQTKVIPISSKTKLEAVGLQRQEVHN